MDALNEVKAMGFQSTDVLGIFPQEWNRHKEIFISAFKN